MTVFYSCADIKNFGDIFTAWLFEQLTGQAAEFSDKKELFISGSILQDAVDNTIVMGAGYGAFWQHMEGSAELIYVRGPLSANILTTQGYGWTDTHEPALCLAEFYQPCQKEYEIGYLPHYIDTQQPPFESWHYIDICSGVDNVCRELLKCKAIVTSSLHGMVAADAFGIPYCFVRSDNRIDTDGFKYFDYWALTGSPSYMPVLKTSPEVQQILNITKKPVNLYENKRYLKTLQNILK